eukprot:gnl/MRDRNA2_/MRDRNA2_106844_c0_seq1.p1 gnl/MRDRNA2_/MRDRNA2_106844_c0~~gnl/MRDRNA2_/MRDRNA2_106844_c0_seq1.p1  ORF type:complete len:135 (-),score=22.00 gnl/MRDRNA2_/MRDRNA2_106844_c0_seq1:57-461(-)
MASNSLRGGKNIYGPQNLTSNWFEERFEPHYQSKQAVCANQLPSKTAKTWSTTTHSYGAVHQEAMRKQYSATETTNWLKYQKDAPYQTTTGDSFVEPKAQSPPFQAPHIAESSLQEYRDMWTRGEPHLYAKLDL